jgi:AcrR family transcriptional regulator
MRTPAGYCKAVMRKGISGYNWNETGTIRMTVAEKKSSAPALRPKRVVTAKAPVRARGRARVEKIIETTIKLLETYELDDLTVMMIADLAEIGRSSIDEYFPTVSAIFRVIAERYAGEIVRNTGQLLVDLDSHSLPEIVDILIDGTVDFWNERPAAAKVHLGSDASFALRVMIKDFHRAGASVYHQWYTPDWNFEPLGDEDPLRTLSVLQYALFSESVQRHGRITDYYRSQTKLVAHGYLSQFTSAIRPMNERTRKARTPKKTA